MRYLLHTNQIHELVARQQYLYDVFRLFFIPTEREGDYIPLIPVGTKGPEILFITGHTSQVGSYLEKFIGQIPEKTLIVTSCFGKNFKKYATRKNVYVPHNGLDFCLIRKGEAFGFAFDISDAELGFYNATGGLMERIKAAYSRL